MATSTPFTPFPKIPRHRGNCLIQEKIDGTNSSIYIGEDGEFLVGSRTRWITPDDDNFGFARWAYQNKEDLLTLGPGHHFGEWWGVGIQRNYHLSERRFSLFNTSRWSDANVRPKCCSCVPLLYAGPWSNDAIDETMAKLKESGSIAAPGFMNPEGVVVYVPHARRLFKRTFNGDGHKGEAADA